MKLFKRRSTKAEPPWSERVVKSIRGDKQEGWLRVEVVGYIRNLTARDNGDPEDGIEFFGRVGWAMTINDKSPPGAIVKFRQTDSMIEGRGAIYGGYKSNPDSYTRPLVNISIVGDEMAERALKEMCDLAAVTGIKHVPLTLKWTIPERYATSNDAMNLQMAVERYSFGQNLLLFNKSFSQDADMEEAFFTPRR
ncbi:hypothetical protein [Chenggangzhangella methanolivorans]|uniref:Uncharacterized protein n=1 Tax=Chenggangzhangella methanolivorans TaxID=1437009 RepID=A0A9E6REA4_9HYPH|nr:hypothetical protein [Chenggangzhangella methanolivorans]QZN99600.1 hypothetical protein K6K41_23355 [Chenggangzhangella methanolivorans]